MAELLKGKRGLITGIANDRSIAWGIAEAMKAEGAELAFGVQMDVFGEKVKPLAADMGVDLVLDYNVQDDASTQAAFDTLADKWGGLDFAVHAIAYSDKSELTGRFINTSRANFKNSLEISAYSFIDMAKKAEPLMKDGGTLITLTYQGSRKATPWYNVMGVAKAALESAVVYLANDLGPQKNSRECDFSRPDENPLWRGHWRCTQDLPLHRSQHAPARQCHQSLNRRHGGLFGIRLWRMHHGRDHHGRWRSSHLGPATA